MWIHVTDIFQGVVFLEKTLFTSYIYHAPTQSDEEDDSEAPPFQVSLSALLETLQIFGANEKFERGPGGDSTYGSTGTSSFYPRNTAASTFEQRAYGTKSLCRLSYAAVGDPLSIVLEDAGVTTTCQLNTFEPEYLEEIPLQKDAIAQKIIMRSSWLQDAINELSSTSPTRLTITSSPTAPCLVLSATGPLGSAAIEFTKDPQLLETFQVSSRLVNTYKFSQIRAANRAMEIAHKVSIRTDKQGVLSLQFMIEVETGGFSFVDFRFVPFLPEDGDGDGSEEEVAGDSEL